MGTKTPDNTETSHVITIKRCTFDNVGETYIIAEFG